jgi:hypothetical protein
MKKSEVLKIVHAELGSALSGTEFKLVKREEGFVRRIPGGKQVLGIPLVNYEPVFIVGLIACIRLEAVEDIFHLFSGSPTREYQLMSFTTGTPLRYFAAGASEFKIGSHDELLTALDSAAAIVRSKILPFFEMHQDVQSLDATINNGGVARQDIEMRHEPAGAMRAVILAHLAGNSNFEQLVARRRSEMGVAEDNHEHMFNRLVVYLRDQTRAES